MAIAPGVDMERAIEPGLSKRAALWLAALGPFFFLSYGFANWVTSHRAHVPFIVFDWERNIPFIAWTIVPYWSTDLLYAVSFFVCRTKQELDTHGLRLLTAQVLSVAGFLLFPLRFTFHRPDTEGAFHWMFQALSSFDQPFNQAPSLHLSLTAILWVRFSAHLDGTKRGLMRAWLLLIALSTLTTYQHHFIDLPAGLLVGLVSVGLFPDAECNGDRSTRDTERTRLTAAYLAGSLALTATAFRFHGLALVLLWPSVALLIVATAYWTGRTGLFQKKAGTIRFPMAWLLAPYSAAARLNSRWWTRSEPLAQEIDDSVWMGRLPRMGERDRLGMVSLLDLTAELPVQTAGVVYRCVPMLDLVAPTVDQLNAAVQVIEELKSGRPTLVCCALGYSRSAAVMAAWLLCTRRVDSVPAAIALLSARRPGVRLSRAHRSRLEEYFCSKH